MCLQKDEIYPTFSYMQNYIYILFKKLYLNYKQFTQYNSHPGFKNCASSVESSSTMKCCSFTHKKGFIISNCAYN